MGLTQVEVDAKRAAGPCDVIGRPLSRSRFSMRRFSASTSATNVLMPRARAASTSAQNSTDADAVVLHPVLDDQGELGAVVRSILVVDPVVARHADDLLVVGWTLGCHDRQSTVVVDVREVRRALVGEDRQR